MMYRSDGSATFVGLERVVGHVAGKAGSFVLQRTGLFENGVAKESYLVVPAIWKSPWAVALLPGYRASDASSEVPSFTAQWRCTGAKALDQLVAVAKHSSSTSL